MSESKNSEKMFSPLNDVENKDFDYPKFKRFWNIILVICFGIIATLVTYEGFGFDSHIEHLPIILKAIDGSYLKNDFLTNAGSVGIARQYYTLLISKLAGSEANLPGMFLALTILANSSLAVSTYFFASYLHKKSTAAGLLASAFVMSISTTAFGGTYPHVYSTYLLQSFIAFALVLWAMVLASKRSFISAMSLIGFSSIIHPQWGLEMGALVLFSYFVSVLIFEMKIDAKQLREITIGLAIFIIFSLPSIIPQLTQQSIDINTFVHIAYFRNGHHYLPSTFPLIDIITAIGFLVAIGISWCRGLGQRENFSNTFSTLIIGLILLLCVGSWFLVEVFPSRIWVITQVFRLFSMIRWLGLIMIAGFITSQSGKQHILLLYLLSIFHPVFFAISMGSQSLKDWLRRKNSFLHYLFEPIAVLLLIFMVYYFFFISIPFVSVLLFTLYVLLILIFANFPGKWLPLAFASIVCLCLVGITFHNRVSVNKDSFLYGKFNRIYDQLVSDRLTLSFRSDLGDGSEDVIDFALKNTPADSIFLTPPDWGQFRLLAERAIVVDFNAFVFTDIEMLEWYERITASYGSSNNFGKEALEDLLSNYLAIDDEQIGQIKRDYGISYVVLYAETTTNHKVIYQNEQYKIIEVREDY